MVGDVAVAGRPRFGARRHLSDRGAVALAGAAWLGATLATPVPLVAAGLVVAVAFLARRPVLLVLGAGLLAAALGARAEGGLDPPPASRVAAEVTLLSDPVEVRGALRVDVRVGRRRVEAWARGAPAAALRDRLAGERVEVEGRLRPPPDMVRARLARRHVVARLDVASVGDWRAGSAAARAGQRPAAHALGRGRAPRRRAPGPVHRHGASATTGRRRSRWRTTSGAPGSPTSSPSRARTWPSSSPWPVRCSAGSASARAGRSRSPCWPASASSPASSRRCCGPRPWPRWPARPAAWVGPRPRLRVLALAVAAVHPGRPA